MSVRLSALFALVSAATYVACGASDPVRQDQDGGAGGQAGESVGEGGSGNTVAGSKNGGGTNSNPGGGEGGDPGIAGAPLGGLGGATEGGAGIVGGAGGEGGGDGVLGDDDFPPQCGVQGDYQALDGTTDADTFTDPQLSTGDSKVFVRGLAGDDIFPYDNEGQDCLVGGAGDDDLSAPGEMSSVLYGGSGTDVFHLSYTTSGAPSLIVDMTSDDQIGLLKTTFTFLNGVAGDPADATQVLSIPDYEGGVATIPNGEGAAIVYDPNTGGLWHDNDRGNKGVNDIGQLIQIANPGSYEFDINDFVLD